jgi:hypothetical protein
MAKVESTDDNLYDGNLLVLSLCHGFNFTQAFMAMNSKKTLQFLLLATPLT